MVDEEVSFENAFETTLTAEFGPTDLTASVVTKGTLTTPTILVIEPDDDAQREYVRFNGVFGASSFVTTNVSFRYLVGSAAPSGLTHPSGAIVRQVATGQAYEDLHDRIDAHDTKAAHDALNIDADTLDGLDSLAFVEGTDHDKAQHDALLIDAATLDTIDSTGFTLIAHDGAGGTAHADVVAAGADGFMTGADKTKLDNLGVWKTDWTPAYVNITVGNGVVVARYVEIGDFIVAQYMLTFGTTTTMGSSPTISLPVTADTSFTALRMNLGSAILFEDGIGLKHGFVRRVDSTTVRPFVFKADGTYLESDLVSATVPHTWGTNDILSFTIIIEKA